MPIVGYREFEFRLVDYDEWIIKGTLWLHEKAIETVDDEWRSMFYDLHTPEDIAEHIIYNKLINGIGLSKLDGWADMPDQYAIIMHSILNEDVEIVVAEKTKKEKT